MSSNITNEQDVAIDLFVIWQLLWRSKLFILSFVFVSSVLAVLVTLQLPNVYKSSTLIAPQDDKSGSLGALASQFGGLASMAGINLGNNESKTNLYIEVLKSREFLYQFFEKNNVAVKLTAIKSWDKGQDKITYDAKKYNIKSHKWLVDDETKESLAPTNQELYEEFNKHLSIEPNKGTGFITLTFKHIVPRISKQWLMALVEALNEKMRQQEIEEKQQSIDYLKQQLEKTDVAEMQNVFYNLIEEQTKLMLLAEVKKDFAFKVIDKAVLPEKKSEPKRAVICLIAAIFAGFVAVFIVLFREFIKNKTVSKIRS